MSQFAFGNRSFAKPGSGQTYGLLIQSGRFSQVALCTQQAWLTSGTVRENVLFMQDYDEERYRRAVAACCLLPDFEQLPDGDETMVGERGTNMPLCVFLNFPEDLHDFPRPARDKRKETLKTTTVFAGITLSGGQKQRIALARALYRAPDVFILDDVLSAVDPHVADKLIEQCLCSPSAMGDSTRVLVTNSLPALRRCSRIYLVEERTLRSGTLEQLSTGPDASPLLQAMASQHQSPRAGAAAATVSSEVTADEDESHDDADQTAEDAAAATGKTKVPADQTDAVPAKGKIDTTLVKEEERTKGSVDLRVYSRWIVAAGGGLVLGLVVVIFGFLAPETANAGSQLWLGVWTSEGGQEEEGGHSVSYYMLIYSGICGLGMFLVMLRTLTWAGLIVTAAKQIHSDLLSTVLRLPMAFFDSTPTGRIINRFSHDIAEIDTQLGVKIQDCLEQVLLMMSALLITVLLLPQLIIFLVPIGFVYRSLMNYYRATNRDIKRLESVSRSPLYAHFSESLAGLSTIRGYAKGERFVKQNQEFVERYVQASTYQAASRWWLGMRIDGLSASLSFLVAMFLVTNRETLSPAVAGLLLVQTTKAIQNFRWVLKRLVDVESAAVCLERVMSYTDLQTPRYHLSGDPQQADFPTAGKLVFENVCMRYRPGLPLALDEASFEVRAGESVGVCGRTGAGKSTLANVIFRMCELSSGRILIDGYDISKLGLETLRTNLGIVPQDPAMFRCVSISR